jgi:hypothetical protein
VGRWAKITTRKSRTIKYIKEKKEIVVEEDRRNQLDTKLKEMIKHLEQAEAKHKEPATQSGTGNAIRRREGQKAKRFYV